MNRRDPPNASVTPPPARPTEPAPGESRWQFYKRVSAWDAEHDTDVIAAPEPPVSTPITADELEALRRQVRRSRAEWEGR